MNDWISLTTYKTIPLRIQTDKICGYHFDGQFGYTRLYLAGSDMIAVLETPDEIDAIILSDNTEPEPTDPDPA